MKAPLQVHQNNRAKHTTADSQETNINQGIHLYFVLKLPKTNKTAENIIQAITDGSLVLTVPAQIRAGQPEDSFSLLSSAISSTHLLSISTCIKVPSCGNT